MERFRLISIFEILLAVVCTVSIRGTLGKAHAVSLRGACSAELVSSVWNAKEAYFDLYPDKADRVKGQLKGHTGIDVDNEEQMEKVVCQVVGADSLDEVAAIFKMPPAMFIPTYAQFKEKIKSIGGIEGIKQAASLERAFFSELDLINFPNFPLRISYDAAFYKIKTWVDVFGEDFIHLIILEEDVPLFKTDQDIANLAKAISEATSLDDLADRAGWESMRLRMAMMPYTYPFENNKYIEALIFNLRWDILMRDSIESGFWDLD